MSELSVTSIGKNLRTDYIGQNVIYYPRVESTQDIAAERAACGAPEGTVVIADEQSAGRGRLERQWFAPRESSLLFSLIFRPQIPLAEVQQLTMLCSLAITDAITELYPLQPGVKWPNDIYLDGKKLGGILTTASFTGASPDYVIVGIGLNINLDVSTLPPLMAPAISLSEALGHTAARLPLLQRILEQVEHRYNLLKAGAAQHEEWANRLVIMRQPVRIATLAEVIEGIAEGVDASGALLLREADGNLMRIIAGDVMLHG